MLLFQANKESVNIVAGICDVVSINWGQSGPLLQGLLMSNHTHHVYTHCTHQLYPIRSTPTGSSHDLLEEESQQGTRLLQ